jgi:hypothetical protein
MKKLIGPLEAAADDAPGPLLEGVVQAASSTSEPIAVRVKMLRMRDLSAFVGERNYAGGAVRAHLGVALAAPARLSGIKDPRETLPSA